jgi:ATP synthase protein I
VPDGPGGRNYRQLAEASAIGLLFPAAMAIGFGVGYWLDRFFGTTPWLAAVFTFLGMVAAFLNLFRVSQAYDRNSSGGDRHDRSDRDRL